MSALSAARLRVLLFPRSSSLFATFTHMGLQYEASVSCSGNFSFALTGGNSRRGAAYPCNKNVYNLFPEEPIYTDVNLHQNAFPVYRKAGEILLNWLHTQKLWRIGFVASTDRKVKVYRWIAARLARRLPRYSLIEYPAGEFNFYRVIKRADYSNDLAA